MIAFKPSARTRDDAGEVPHYAFFAYVDTTTPYLNNLSIEEYHTEDFNGDIYCCERNQSFVGGRTANRPMP